ncbi:MAG: TolC family protein [Hymenobacter sp.]|nr:TolC family protein [Hymenobacter sp.]
MKAYLIGLLGLLGLPALAQPELTLTQCYAAARANYPLLRQQGILKKADELAVAKLTTNRRLPQLAVNGQASWQSAVTQLAVDMPGVRLPALSKNQYKLTLDATYTLYDGRQTRLQTTIQRATSLTDQRQIEVELYGLKERVDGLFLNALLTDEQIRLTQMLLTDLRSRVEKLRAGVRFGSAAPNDVDVLRVEQLTSEQRLADLTATRRGQRDALHLLTELPVADSTRLVVDLPPLAINQPVVRPELQLYQAQHQLYDARLQFANNRFKPRFSLFSQSGVARPALNFLNNEFERFFIGGLRLSWDISSAYTIRNDRQILQLNQQTVAVRQAAFEKDLTVELRQQQTEIERLQAQLAKDADIVAVRARVRQATAAQLDNGVADARDYTTELTNENQARLDQKLHELQLVQAQMQYRTLTGN